MKKGISLSLMLLLSVIIVIPSISAIDITLSKTSYNPQETLQAEITGSFTSLTLENILIYEGETPRSQPVISDLTKQGNIYYFYAVLPNEQGNFSLKIKDAEYLESGQTKTDTIIKEFIIQQSATNQSLLQISNGFIVTSEDFSIKVKALNSNQEITTNFDGQSESLSLIEEVQETLEFSITPSEFGKSNLVIGSYTIPVFIIEKTQPQNQTDVTNESTANQSSQTDQPTTIDDLNETEIEDYLDELGETESLSCYDIGRICLVNQECEGEKVASLEGSCCIGDCVEEKEGGGKGWLIGVIILVVVVGFVGFMYWKSKKKQKPRSTSEILKERGDKFEERMGERRSSGEVSKSLGKI